MNEQSLDTMRLFKTATGLLIYGLSLVFYYWSLHFLDRKSDKFETVLSTYPHYAETLYVEFVIVNLVFKPFKVQADCQRRSYLYVLLWLPYLLFLAVIAVVYFYGIALIGAPFVHNWPAHLFIAHTLGYFARKLFYSLGGSLKPT